MNTTRTALALIATLALTCGAWAQPTQFSTQRFPDVIAVKVRPVSNDSFDFDIAISSPYDTPQRVRRCISGDGQERAHVR